MARDGAVRFDPYRALSALGVDISVEPLGDDLMGCYEHDDRTVRLACGLLQSERRCTAAHEYVHAVRGDEPSCSDWHDRKQEHAVERTAARLLIPLDDLARAVMWSDDPFEVADDLWVDVDTLQHRLRHLEPGERSYLARRCAARDGSTTPTATPGTASPPRQPRRPAGHGGEQSEGRSGGRGDSPSGGVRRNLCAPSVPAGVNGYRPVGIARRRPRTITG